MNKIDFFLSTYTGLLLEIQQASKRYVGGNRIEKLTNIKSNAKDKEMRLKELLANSYIKLIK